ncbi:hypothetical protein SAMN05216298_0285 [Glycomyces sambucus]|uniref:Uncharacterized protein n=1 Tax=Glycomyces sambucus TaxID=380244 RepID=A0A1G9CDY4_9ACTN|nr:hypothetical protein [Glycomyces sambucus]SDK49869.1 hypothetical protein SAMN05216298_0285 [Glycomyces sambucus]
METLVVKPPRKPKRPRRPQIDSNSAAPPALSEGADADALWMSLRQGARNVAGVTWQIAVTAHLAIEAHAGERDFTRIVPEGYEDIDCLTSSGSRVLLQVKEKGAGAGTMPASEVADVLAHAAKAGRYVDVRSIVLVTDGELGSGLSFTEWDETLSTPSTARDGLIELLISRDIDPQLANRLVAQTHLVRLPWNLRASSELLLRTSSGIHPSVATLVVSELYAQLHAAAAEQRSRPRANAVAIAPGDIDTLIEQIQSTVDVAGLDAAVAAGVCGSADFITDSGVRPDQFYLGVDGAPGHIAADLDVLRPREMTLMVEAAQDQRCALVVGPSGCGKSVLLWRAARDAVLGSRIVRVRRVRSDEDVSLLIRHVQLARPTVQSPVIVVADNLGRPHMEHWPDVVSGLRELPGVILFGACRAEDFHPRLARGAAQIVRPMLDDQTAQRIAQRLNTAGLPSAMASAEAFQRCEGHLMEYLALLLKGQRLQLILSEQAAGLREPGRELQRRAARLITGAHSLGFALPVETIKAAFAPSVSAEDLSDALRVLRGEHLIVLDGDTWRGLHELRSRTLTEQLHDAPPPSFGETLAEVARIVTTSEASWLLRRTAERFPRSAPYVAGALAEHLRRSPNLDAATLAELLEGAERADNLIYARACLRVFTAELPEGWSIDTAASFAYAIKRQGTLAEANDANSRVIRLALSPLVRAMPERSEEVLVELSSALNANNIAELAQNAGLVDVVRLLEALAGTVPLEQTQIEQVHRHFSLPSNRAEAAYWARLTEALFHLLPRDTAATALGSIEHRANIVAKAERWAFAIAMEDDVPHVSILQASEIETISDSLSWEPDEHPNADTLEAIAIALSNRIASACPDAPAVGVRTYSPSGRPFMADGYEPARRLISSTVRAERTGVRRNVGFCAALRRLAAAETWTELLTEEARLGAELLALAAEAPYRLKTTDNVRRRSEWATKVDAVQRQANMLQPEPPALDDGLPLRMRRQTHAKDSQIPPRRHLRTPPLHLALSSATLRGRRWQKL